MSHHEDEVELIRGDTMASNASEDTWASKRRMRHARSRSSFNASNLRFASWRVLLRQLGRNVSLFLTGQLVLDPEGTFRRVWDIFVVFAVVWNVLSVPWFIAFDPMLALAFLPLDVIVLIVMSTDMLFVFRSGYVAFGAQMVFDSREVAIRYITSVKFTLDLLSVLPIEFIAFGLPNTVNGDVRFTLEFWYAILKVKQLLRLHKLFGNPRIDEFFQTPKLRVLKIFILWCLIAHFFASVLVFVAIQQPGGDQTNWMRNSGLEPPVSTYVLTGKESTKAELYIAGLYWTFVAMTSVGYSFIPTTTAEQVVIQLILVLSLAFYAAMFASLADSLRSFQNQSRSYQKRMDSTKEYAQAYKLPVELAGKMNRYKEAEWINTHGFKMDEILGHLPLSVQAEVMLYIHRAMIDKVPFFSQCSSRFLDALILRLGPPVVLLQGDMLFREGDRSRSLYFLREGSVDVLMENPISHQEESVVRVSPMSEAPFVGEIALLLGITRTASVRAAEQTVCNVLTAEDFFDLLAQYPDEEVSLREAAAERLQSDYERMRASAAARDGAAVGNRRYAMNAVDVLGAVIMRRVMRLEQGKLGEHGEPLSSVYDSDESNSSDDDDDDMSQMASTHFNRYNSMKSTLRTHRHQPTKPDASEDSPQTERAERQNLQHLVRDSSDDAPAASPAAPVPHYHPLIQLPGMPSYEEAKEMMMNASAANVTISPPTPTASPSLLGPARTFLSPSQPSDAAAGVGGGGEGNRRQGNRSSLGPIGDNGQLREKVAAMMRADSLHDTDDHPTRPDTIHDRARSMLQSLTDLPSSSNLTLPGQDGSPPSRRGSMAKKLTEYGSSPNLAPPLNADSAAGSRRGSIAKKQLAEFASSPNLNLPNENALPGSRRGSIGRRQSGEFVVNMRKQSTQVDRNDLLARLAASSTRELMAEAVARAAAEDAAAEKTDEVDPASLPPGHLRRKTVTRQISLQLSGALSSSDAQALTSDRSHKGSMPNTARAQLHEEEEGKLDDLARLKSKRDSAVKRGSQSRHNSAQPNIFDAIKGSLKSEAAAPQEEKKVAPVVPDRPVSSIRSPLLPSPPAKRPTSSAHPKPPTGSNKKPPVKGPVTTKAPTGSPPRRPIR